MYCVHVEFTDGSKPFDRFRMTRSEYGSEMRRIEREYKVKVNDTQPMRNGDVMIYATAIQRLKIFDESKDGEKAKSRARYYSKLNAEH